MLSFQITSDTDHDNVVAEVNHEGKFLCLLSKENDDDDVMIELPIDLPTTSPESFKRILLVDFIRTLDHAKDHLINPK